MKNVVLFLLFLVPTISMGQVQFKEQTSVAGLTNPNQEDYSYSSSMVDIDNDDLLDLFIAHGNDHFDSFNQLYHNLGNGIFTDITKSAFAAAVGSYTGGHCWGDFNNDGFPDLYESHFNSATSTIWQNNNGKTFANASNLFEGPGEYATGAIWSDINLDGKLDLLVHTQSGTGSIYYENNGSSFDKKDILHSAGIGDEILTTDINNDNRPDVLFGNAHGIDSIFLSNGNSFSNFSTSFLAAVRDLSDYPGSATFGDIDNDGYPDLLIHYPEKFFLFHNNEGKDFTDITTASGLDGAKPKVHLGSFICDIDNDGWNDIILLNRSDTSQIWYGSAGGFTKTDLPINSFKYISGNAIQSLAIGDYDNDGFIDLLHCKQGETHLWHNEGNINRWLNIKLQGHRANYQGLGAKVISYYATRPQYWTMGFSQGYYGHIAQIAHFGFGPSFCGSTNIIDSVVIIWQPGGRQVLRDVPMNEFIVVDQDSGIVRTYAHPIVENFVGYVSPYYTPGQRVVQQTPCPVPLSIRIPKTLQGDVANELTFGIEYNQDILDISPTKVAQHYTAPSGWAYKSSSLKNDSLLITITGTAHQPLADSFYIGTLRFDTYYQPPYATNLRLVSVFVLDSSGKKNLCVSTEGSYMTYVEIDSAAQTGVAASHGSSGKGLIITPNPAGSDQISIECLSGEHSLLRIYDILGRAVYEQTDPPMKLSQYHSLYKVTGSVLAPGSYIIQVITSAAAQTGRLVINR